MTVIRSLTGSVSIAGSNAALRGLATMIKPARGIARPGGTHIHPNAATILPRYASSVNVFFAWGLKHMIAGLVLVSAAVGLMAVAAGILLSVPTWLILVGYPVVSSLTLMLAATFSGLRATSATQAAQMLHPQA